MDVILREIRELGESIILIDQHPSLISVPSLGNTYGTIAMNLKHGRDVSTIANAMLLSPDDKESLGRLPVGDGIVRLQGRWYKPFLVRFPLLEVKKGSVMDADLTRQIQADSRPSGEIRPVQPMMAEIPPIPAEEKLSKEEIELLKDVMENITSPIVERYRRLGFSAHFGTKTSRSLISKGLIDAVPINLGGGRRIRMLWLSDKGRIALTAMGINLTPRNRGGPEHEYWKARVAEHLLSHGYAVEVEKPLGGGKAIDLVASKDGHEIAVEIETGNSDALENIRKCSEASYNRIILLITSSNQYQVMPKTVGVAQAASVDFWSAARFVSSWKPPAEESGP